MSPVTGDLKIWSSRTVNVNYMYIGPGAPVGYPESVVYSLEIANHNNLADTITTKYGTKYLYNIHKLVADHVKGEDNGTLPGKGLSLKISWS